MRKLAVFLLVIVSLALLISPAYAVVSSNDLINNPKDYDGKNISFQGEAIGDVMERGTHGWVNIHDGSNAIGVWVPVAELRKITRTGDYRNIGDTVLVEGVFNQACVKHNGELDIHAESITVVEMGSPVERPLDANKAVAAGVLVLIAGVLFAANRRKEHFPGASS